MRFLDNSNDLIKEFIHLCKKYYHYAWATAWAGNDLDEDFTPGKFINKYIDRIDYFVVGLHFYQTSPLFIKHFIDDDRIRFFNDTKGVFHSKVYFFYNGNENAIEEWSAIIGSSNFTIGGFSKNTEANILISSDDTDNQIGIKIFDFIKSIWNQAKLFSERDYKKYLATYKDMVKKRNTFSKTKPIRGNERSTDNFKHMSWNEYSKRIKQYPDSYNSRVDILKEAGNIFRNNKWIEISDIDKAHIGGYGKGIRTSKWANFGWNQYLNIKSEFINHKLLAEALDSIPLYPKPISTKDGISIAKKICKAVNTNGVATFSRYMSMKRPDLYICCNGQNTILRKNYHLPKNINLENYFKLLLQRIYSDSWFIEADSNDELYPYRVAMLDTFLNDWSQPK